MTHQQRAEIDQMRRDYAKAHADYVQKQIRARSAEFRYIHARDYSEPPATPEQLARLYAMRNATAAQRTDAWRTVDNMADAVRQTTIHHNNTATA